MRATVKGKIVDAKPSLAVVKGKIVEVKNILSVVKGKLVEVWANFSYNITGYVLSGTYLNGSSEYNNFSHYDVENKVSIAAPVKSTSNKKAMSADGKWVLVQGDDYDSLSLSNGISIYKYDGTVSSLVQTMSYTADIYNPLGVSTLGTTCSEYGFTADGSRLVFLTYWKDSTTTDYQYGLVIFKRGSGDIFSYEKRVVLFTTSSSVSWQPFASDDFSVIALKRSSTSSAYMNCIYKGDLSSGYEQIYSASSTSITAPALDMDKGEYVIVDSGGTSSSATKLLYINGKTVTALTKPSMLSWNGGTRIVFNADRTKMYVSYSSYNSYDSVYCFAISNKTSVTYLGRYYVDSTSTRAWFIYDRSPLKKAILSYYDDYFEDYITAYGTLSEDSSGTITGFAYSDYINTGGRTYRRTTRFINKEAQ